ncbi:MAG: hypothetical protein HZA88_21445 [Verrucomicrobia bacterium]|nr:hypothetical protein [Verrucomicrobiota bacterium]
MKAIDAKSELEMEREINRLAKESATLLIAARDPTGAFLRLIAKTRREMLEQQYLANSYILDAFGFGPN